MRGESARERESERERDQVDNCLSHGNGLVETACLSRVTVGFCFGTEHR